VLQPDLWSTSNLPIMTESSISDCMHSMTGHTACRVYGTMKFSSLFNAQLLNLKGKYSLYFRWSSYS